MTPFDETRAWWPADAIASALREVLRRGDVQVAADLGADLDRATGANELLAGLRRAATRAGLEAAHETVASSRLEEALAEPGPYLLVELDGAGRPSRALGVLREGAARCVLMTPAGETRGFLWEVTQALAPLADTVEALRPLFEGLDRGGAALARLVADGDLDERSVFVARFVRDAASPFLSQLGGRPLARLGAYLGWTALQAIVAGAAAWTLGTVAMSGRIDTSQVVAWSLLAISDVPMQYVASLALGGITLDFSAAMKRRLLDGALHVDPALVDRDGFAAILARLSEASVVEQTSAAEVAGLAISLAQLLVAFWVLAHGVWPLAMCGLLVLVLAAASALVASAQRRYVTWYRARLGLTQDLLEKIVGHRTRAVQAAAGSLHADEDAAFSTYDASSRSWDDASVRSTMFGRVWLALAAAILVGAYVAGAPTGALEVAVLGAYLAHRSVSGALAGASRFIALRAAWDGIRGLFRAGGERSRLRDRGVSGDSQAGLDTLVSNVSFAYHAGASPVLSNVSLRVRDRERVLVEGPSGGGKTTLSKLLTGELRASTGTILVEGVDAFSVPEAEWRRKVAASPQFHENHVFSNTFAFNVDPRCGGEEMSIEAFKVCEELGLGPLMRKMPSGTAQLVGDNGWQLSHGERSRLYIARALLQGAGLVIFDESFGALDPESLAVAFECVKRRARTLVVIAHI